MDGSITYSIAANEGWELEKARKVYQAMKDAMRDALVRDGDLIIQDFGRFKTVTRKARTIFHPYKRVQITYPARTKVVFAPGEALKDALN